MTTFSSRELLRGLGLGIPIALPDFELLRAESEHETARRRRGGT